MSVLWWIGYAGIMVFAILVVSLSFGYVADTYGAQNAWNGFMWLCIVWLMIRVELKRV